MEVGRQLGRSPSDCEPISKILLDNWFDTPDSLAHSRTEELAALGIPLRFSQQLFMVASQNSSGPSQIIVPEPPSAPPPVVTIAPPPAAIQPGQSQNSVLRPPAAPSAVLAIAPPPAAVSPGSLQISVPPPPSVPTAPAQALVLTIAPPPAAIPPGSFGPGHPPQPPRGINQPPPGNLRRLPPEPPRSANISRTKIINVREFDPTFRVRGSILGPKGRNLHHIQDQTKARIELRGDSPMQVVISDAPSPASGEKAYRMCVLLLQAVSNEYQEWRKSQSPSSGTDLPDLPLFNCSHDEGAPLLTLEECEFHDALDIQELDEAFPLREIILGYRNQNMMKIVMAGGASDLRGGADGEPMVLHMGAKAQETLRKIVDIGEDVLAKTYEAYDKWLQNGGKDDEADEEHGLPALDDSLDGTSPMLKRGRFEDGFGGEGEDAGCFFESDEFAEDGSGSPKKRRIEPKEGDIEVEWDVRGGVGRIATPPPPPAPPASRDARLFNQVDVDSHPEYFDFLDIDIPCGDQRFTARGKILGRGGSRLNEIQQRFGVKVHLSGHDGGSLKIEVSSISQTALRDAMRELEDVVNDVCDDYQRCLADSSGSKSIWPTTSPKSDTSGGGGGAFASAKFRKILKLRDTDPEFDVRKRIRGERCQNLHHIQDMTKAQLWVAGGENGDPVRIEVAGENQPDFDQALSMAKDLVKAIFKDYESWEKDRNP